jgi:AraC family transcriptional regulator
MFTESLVTTLVAHIYRTYTSTPPIIVKGGLTPRQTSRVLAYVRNHLGENISVEDLAAEVGLSSHYFTETFRRTIGVTPYRYLSNQRIEKSKELLRQGKHSIGKIAKTVGFSSHKQFSSHFRKVVGVTPAQYRRECI